MSTSRRDDRLVRYPDELARRYRRSGLWGTRTIADELRAVALAHPRREAVVALDGRMTYRELDERTDVLAAGLTGLGLLPGDPVLFQVTNRLAAIVAWYGVLKAGLVPVCTLAAHRGHEIGEVSRRVGAVAHLVEAGTRGFDLVGFAAEQQRDHPTLRHVLVLGAAGGTSDDTSGDTGGVAIESLGAGADPRAARTIVEGIQRGIDPDDVAVFQLSGGTTGVPKVIPRLHAEYWYNAAAYARSWGWSPDTRVAHLIPVIHNAGIVCAVHAPHSAGACLVLGNSDLTDSLSLMAREGATHVLLGHGHFKAVAEPGFAAAASVTQVVLSGAKVPPALFDELEQRGLWSGQLFGMGEGLFLTTRPGAPREARATTVGTPLSPMDEIRILEPGSATELPDGQVGELCCRGPYTLRGYFDADAHNARAFTPDGFYRTGDLALVRDIGGQRYVSIEGRIKDVINRGGEKINAEEVELLLLLRHPRITDAAVVAMPDPRLGERACAYVVVHGEPVTMAEIRQHFTQLQVATFKWPERIEHLPEIPRTLVGKTDKKRLQAGIAAQITAERGALQSRS